MSPRYFSVEEANALVPRLSTVFRRLTELREEISARANEIERMGFNPAVSDAKTIPQQILDRRKILEARVADFQREVRGIEELGGQLKDLDLGLVDFPALLAGEAVLLCWQYGEPAILHYHSPDEGFRGRRRLEGHAEPVLN